jgi:hypothetical protein
MPLVAHKVWMGLGPPRNRNKLIAFLLASAAEKIDLPQLEKAIPEIKKVRHELFVFNKIALLHKVPVDHKRADKVLGRLDHLLGGSL